MAKPKHPTIKSLRQGQTVYEVRAYPGEPATVNEMHLHSKREPLPSEACVIERMPVTLIQRHLRRYPHTGRWMFYSRGKAITAASKVPVNW